MMAWIAIMVSIGAGLVTLATVFANGMRSSPGEFKGRNLIALAWMIAALFWIAWAVDHPVHARDLDGRYAQSPLKSWFDQLKSRNGLCCSDADGWALSGVDWESRSGKYRVRIPKTQWLPTKEQREPPPEVELVWFDVPDDAVITEPNRAGRAMVWPAYGYWGIKIVCFMPGPMT